jgi:hypothetical protein
MDQTSPRKAGGRHRYSLHRLLLHYYSFQRPNVEMGLREFTLSTSTALRTNKQSLWQLFLPLLRSISVTPDWPYLEPRVENPRRLEARNPHYCLFAAPNIPLEQSW